MASKHSLQYILSDTVADPRPFKYARVAFAPFRLMDLPTEVRLRVLEELLVWEEPLKLQLELLVETDFGSAPWSDPLSPRKRWKRGSSQRLFKLYPAVLRTNRQLYSEGRSLLYSGNTFDVKVFHSDPDSRLNYLWHSEFLVPQWSIFGHIPKHILEQVRKVQVTLMFEPTARHRKMVREGVRDLLGKLSLFSSLESLTVCLERMLDHHLLSKPGLEWDANDAAEALQPFSHFRGLNRCTFAGLVPASALQMVSLMTGHTPVVDLPAMYELMSCYCDTDGYYGNDARCEAYQAMDTDNIETFLEKREVYLEMITHRAILRLEEIRTAVYSELFGDIFGALGKLRDQQRGFFNQTGRDELTCLLYRAKTAMEHGGQAGFLEYRDTMMTGIEHIFSKCRVDVYARDPEERWPEMIAAEETRWQQERTKMAEVCQPTFVVKPKTQSSGISWGSGYYQCAAGVYISTPRPVGH